MQKNKKKILVISHNFWPENFPINDVIEGLSDYYNLTVLTGKPNYPKGKIFKNYNYFFVEHEKYKKKINIHRVPIIPRGKGGKIMKILNYLSFIFSSMIFLFIEARKQKYDVIFVYAPSPVIHSLIGVYLKKIKKIPMIMWLQDLWPVSIESSGQLRNKLLIKLIQNLINYIYSKVDLMLIQSIAYKKHLKGKISNSKVFYVPNAFKKYKEQITNKRNKNFNILYCGNIGMVQEFDSIIYAAKEIQKKNIDINFTFFGEGVNKNLLKKKIIKNELKNFYIKDYVSLSRLVKELSYADALYVSLKNFKELNLTVPSKIQFYMSAGKPILAELSGESAKIIKESKSGVISFPGNKKLLLKNILKLYKLKKKHKLNKLGKNGYDFYKKNYSLNKVIFQIKKCINQLEY